VQSTDRKQAKGREISIEKKGRLQFLSTHSTRKDPHQKSSAGKEYKCC
jgi:hypothetical protein